MDTILLEYKLNVYRITKRQLKNAMGWSEGTRQARCIRGENWLVSEVKKLLDLGFTWDDLRVIFFTPNGSKNRQNEPKKVRL